MDKQFPTPDEIKEFTFGYVLMECDGKHPEDEWTSLDESWDLNIWLKDGVPWVTVYPLIRDGQEVKRWDIGISIDMSDKYPVFVVPEELEEDEDDN